MEISNSKSEFEDLFYSKEFYFSYSSLSKLKHSPGIFYRRYILGDSKDTYHKSTIEGKLIHCLLLNPELFDQEFILMPSSSPSANTIKVIDSLVDKLNAERIIIENDLTKDPELSDYEDDILEILKEQNLHQKLIEDSARISKIITGESSSYFNYKLYSNLRHVIDLDTYDRCLEAKELIMNHPVAKQMNIDKTQDIISLNEIEIKYKDDTFPFGLKGILDNVTIDVNNKILRINDLKTTSKTLHDFKDAVDFWDYWLQAAIYFRLAKAAMDQGSFKVENFNDEWTCIFSFIVIDRYNHIYSFEVSEDSMIKWQIELQDLLHEAKYHYESRDFSLPFNFLKTKIVL